MVPLKMGYSSGHDLLATTARLAGRGSVEVIASGFSGAFVQNQPDRLVTDLHRCRQCTVSWVRINRPETKGSPQIGLEAPSCGRPKRNTIRHKHTAVNGCGITMLLKMVDASPQLSGLDGQLRNCPVKLHAEKGYDWNKHRLALEE